MWEEEPAREAPSVHAGSMSKVQAENGLITSKRGGLEGFTTQLKKVLGGNPTYNSNMIRFNRRFSLTY